MTFMISPELSLIGYIFEFNQQQANLLGYNSSVELIGKNSFDFFAPEYKEAAIRTLQNLFVEQHIEGVIFEIVRKDGSRITGEFSATIINDDNGKPVSIMCLTRDITTRKQAEQAIQNEKLLTEEYINSLPGLFYVFDEKRLIRWNKRWEIVSGYTDDEICKMYGTDFFDGSDKTLIADKMKMVFAEGSAEAEAELVTKQGKRIPYYFSGLLQIFNGKPYLVGLGIDITERKRVEEALWKSDVRYTSLVDQSPVSYEVYNRDGILIRANRAWEKLFEAKKEDVVGKYNIRIDHQLEAIGLKSIVDKAFEGEAATNPSLDILFFIIFNSKNFI